MVEDDRVVLGCVKKGLRLDNVQANMTPTWEVNACRMMALKLSPELCNKKRGGS